MPDLKDLIEQFHAAEAARPSGASIRVYRVGAQWSVALWADHARHMGYHSHNGSLMRSADRNAALSASLGVPVAEVVEICEEHAL